MPSPVSRYCIDGTAAFVLDFETGERRYGTLPDIEDALRVFQQADLGVMAWAPTCASDAPAHSRALHEFFTMIEYSSKHGQHELHRVEQVPYLVAGLKAVAGQRRGGARPAQGLLAHLLPGGAADPRRRRCWTPTWSWASSTCRS